MGNYMVQWKKKYGTSFMIGKIYINKFYIKQRQKLNNLCIFLFSIEYLK